jgi:phosphoribosylformylglycinamidine synthase PurS subunit
MEFIADVYVTLKPTVYDPQGMAILNGLKSLGFSHINDVRTGKFIVLNLDAADQVSAETEVENACNKLLANPVIESYRFEMRAVV